MKQRDKKFNQCKSYETKAHTKRYVVIEMILEYGYTCDNIIVFFWLVRVNLASHQSTWTLLKCNDPYHTVATPDLNLIFVSKFDLDSVKC